MSFFRQAMGCFCILSLVELSLAGDYPVLGKIERMDPRLDAIIPADAKIEVLASGFDWSEGPVWNKQAGFLLFSDVPKNTIYKWSPKDGLSKYLSPSGFSGVSTDGFEPGSNGLGYDAKGNLICCEHGDRRISRMNIDGGKQTIIDSYNGKRLNSPNDLAFRANGDMYFTDPPYGLRKAEKDSQRELTFSGVFRLSPAGKLTLLNDQLTFPNGLAFSPDQKILYVAQSDPEKAIVMAYPVKEDGTLGAGQIFCDQTPWVKQGLPGLPDGMKVDREGNVFCTGPGGVHIFAPDGAHLGTINTGEATGNCCWGDDGKTLYINADMWLVRVKTATMGATW